MSSATPLIIGISGCSGSGKSSIAKELKDAINVPSTEVLDMDVFYRPLAPTELQRAHQAEFDFDAPGALDLDLVYKTLVELKEGFQAEIPVYSFETHSRLNETWSLPSPRVLVLEGILSFFDPRIEAMLDVKIFVEEELDVCLGRRLLRDTEERGRKPESTIKQWFAFTKPSFQRHVLPQKSRADFTLVGGKEDITGIGKIAQHVRCTLQQQFPEQKMNA